ncbi:hypothetical protein AB0A95_12065 [Micromonospora sp. NPDC049230]|uniref:hypothetical protein n=1 Tax=Micromonospora sp. NPDC049230 TaxID=3155502 RepID=UPI0033DB8C55
MTDRTAGRAAATSAAPPLEAAAHREVGEEVRLSVDRLAYFGSQPWAISGPGVLLAGFTARARTRTPSRWSTARN